MTIGPDERPAPVVERSRYDGGWWHGYACCVVVMMLFAIPLSIEWLYWRFFG